MLFIVGFDIQKQISFRKTVFFQDQKSDSWRKDICRQNNDYQQQPSNSETFTLVFSSFPDKLSHFLLMGAWIPRKRPLAPSASLPSMVWIIRGKRYITLRLCPKFIRVIHQARPKKGRKQEFYIQIKLLFIYQILLIFM